MNENLLKTRWRNCNPHLKGIKDIVHKIGYLNTSNNKFIKILKNDKVRADKSHLLDSIGTLNVYSRARLTVPYHFTLVPDERQKWAISYQLLMDALNFAIHSNFIVIFSTLKSGASQPLNIHFQGLPKILEFDQSEYKLFSFLFNSKAIKKFDVRKKVKSFNSPNEDEIIVSRLEYSVFVVKISGPKKDMCGNVFTLCAAYDNYKKFNLIISYSGYDDNVDVYFFPRLLNGNVRPEMYKNERRAFASIEMGCVFPLNDESQFNQLSSKKIISNLKQVSIESGTQEESIICNLCEFV